MGTFSTTNRSALFSRTSTIASADADPNTLLPSMPIGQTNSNGGVEGAPFATPATWDAGASSAILLAMARTAGGNSTATVSVWFFESSGQGSWILVKAGISVVEGTPVVVPLLRGSNFFTYIQVTAVSNTPSGLYAYSIPQP